MTALRIHWAIKLASKPICVLLKEEEKNIRNCREEEMLVYMSSEYVRENSET